MNKLLFDLDPDFESTYRKIPGLSMVERLITDVEHDQLVEQIDSEVWSNELKRRVQHYGYKYSYKSRSITADMAAAPLPDWAVDVATKLVELGIFEYQPDQLIVNEYLPGQGIAPHIDCEPCFSDTIVSLSLGSTAMMRFDEKDGSKTIQVPLKRRCAVVLEHDARYLWYHSIPARKSDIIDGIRVARTRRISLTFRNVIL